MRAELLAAVVLTGCGDPPGPLDRDVVHDLAREAGSAEGTARSQSFSGVLSPIECGCPTVDGLAEFSRCGFAEQFGGNLPVGMNTLQSDGILVVREFAMTLPTTYTGSIEADGSFAVGSIRDVTTSFSRGALISRIDGSFDDQGSLEAELRVRLVGELLPFTADSSGESESYDCVESFSLSRLP